MPTPDFGHIIRDAPSKDQDRERRLALLIGRLPARLRTIVGWLRQPSVRWVRIPAGLLLILGGLFSILPILGLWMLPLGLVLLAEDVPPLRRATGRMLAWIENRRPHWLGVPPHNVRPHRRHSHTSPQSKERRDGAERTTTA